MQRIDRYIFREMMLPFALNVLFFTFIFLITQILEITDMVVNFKVGLATVGRLLLYSSPFFLQFTIPMSVMVTILVTFLRLSGDLEIIALKAGGYSMQRLLVPVIAVCCCGAVLTAWMTFWGLPWGKLSFRHLVTEIAAKHADIALKPRTFNDSFENVTLYISEVDRNRGILSDIFIEDARGEQGMGTVIAPRGKFVTDPDNLTCHLRLFDGMVLRSAPGALRLDSIRFATYDLQLDFRSKGAVVKKKKDKEEMLFPELLQYIATLKPGGKRYNAALMKLHEKFSLPAACFALGLMAFPLGIRPLNRREVSGIRTGLFYFLVYYVLLTMGWSLGETGVYPPAAAMWSPNLVMGGAGFWLFLRIAKEKPARPDFLANLTWPWKRRGV